VFPFARGQIEDSGFCIRAAPFQQRATAGQFHIVGVRGDAKRRDSFFLLSMVM